MSNHRELLKVIITKLTGILGDLEDFETCSKCARPAAARGFCNKHYNRWRRDYCRERQVKNLRALPKNPEPDERQAILFPVPPLGETTAYSVDPEGFYIDF